MKKKFKLNLSCRDATVLSKEFPLDDHIKNNNTITCYQKVWTAGKSEITSFRYINEDFQFKRHVLAETAAFFSANVQCRGKFEYMYK